MNIRAALFEHAVGVTKDEVEIFTACTSRRTARQSRGVQQAQALNLLRNSI
jgi:hypothetical protein